MVNHVAGRTSRPGRRVARIALVAAAAFALGMSTRQARTVDAQGGPCAVVVASPAFAYLHAVATGSPPASPSPYLADCTSEPHPTISGLAVTSVRITDDGEVRQTVVADVDTATDAVGMVTFGEGRDRPRPQAIDYRLLFANHAATAASDPASAAVSVAGPTSGTYDPVVGGLVGFALPPSADPHGTCALVTAQAFADACARFDTGCAEKAASVAAQVCAVIAP